MYISNPQITEKGWDDTAPCSFKSPHTAGPRDSLISKTHCVEHEDQKEIESGRLSCLSQGKCGEVGFSIKRVGQPELWKQWKPTTLKAPILGGFIIISFSTIAVLEVLSHISSRNGNMNGGGLAFAADVSSLPTVTTFCYLYLPTVLAVCYSMLWSWVDLDVKRLEPWLQLSKEDGAAANDSLLLQYPFDFLPFIPIKAVRRKHWAVFFAGTIMLMVFWVITPLQSAIFNTGIVTCSNLTNMGNSGALMPIESQSTALNANFLNTAYGISWLNQSLPPFTTPQYAVLPFQPLSDVESTRPAEAWSTNATAFSTSLSCAPASVTPHDDLTYTFDNGNGCSVPEIGLPDTQNISDYVVLYIGYFSNPQSDWTLQNPNCTAEHANNFLAIWASAVSNVGNGVYSNMTALFCVPSYHTTRVTIQVNASNHAITTRSTDIILRNDTDLPERIFNTTQFEDVIGSGVSSSGQRSDYPDSTILEQYPRLKSYNLTWPVSNMVGFAIALNTLSLDDLAAPYALQQAFEKAHQLLFSAAFATLTEPLSPEIGEDVRPGTRYYRQGSIIMVRSISLVVEVALGIVAALTFLLWCFSSQRPNNLDLDPSSISNIILITRCDGELADLFKDGTNTNVYLEKYLASKTFHLERREDVSFGIARLTADGTEKYDAGKHQGISKQATALASSKELNLPIRPTQLSWSVGSCLIGLILVLTFLLVFLQVWSSKNNGISLPSKNPAILSILENYLPTTFATILEPVWVILNRLLCLLQPFEELRKGNARASTSLDAKYTSLPPQLAVWRALRSQHYLLASVCLITISTNLLAVSLSALFTEAPVTSILQTTTTRSLLPQFNGAAIFNQTLLGAPVTFSDHFYVAESNLSDGTILPSWVDQAFFYIPFDIPTSDHKERFGELQGFRGSTTGFGAEVNCITLSHDISNNTASFLPSKNGQTAQFSTTHIFPNQTEITCFPHDWNQVANQTTGFTGTLPRGLLALEIMQVMTSNGVDDNGFCEALIVSGWVRASSTTTTDPKTGLVNSDIESGTVESTFVGCTQQLLVAQFDVVVDSDGHILEAKRTGDYAQDTHQYFTDNASQSALFQQSSSLIAPYTADDFVWHNDSMTSDWMNALLGILNKSSNLVDPSVPVPEIEDVVIPIQTLYTQLFATLLGLNTHVFSTSEEPASLTADIIFLIPRLFLSPVMFQISLTLLILQLIVAVIYYTSRPKRFLPHMPTSIASIISYVASSHVLQDIKDGNFEGKGSKEEHLYGYGHFIGTDGKTRVGIERQNYVVPLKSRNPEVKRRRWGVKSAKDSEKQPRNWI